MNKNSSYLANSNLKHSIIIMILIKIKILIILYLINLLEYTHLNSLIKTYRLLLKVELIHSKTPQVNLLMMSTGI